MSNKKIKIRILHILIAFDQFIFCLLTLGWSWPDETISARCYRAEQLGKWYGKVFRPFFDFIFSPFEDNHCYESYMSEITRSHLPDDY